MYLKINKLLPSSTILKSHWNGTFKFLNLYLFFPTLHHAWLMKIVFVRNKSVSIINCGVIVHKAYIDGLERSIIIVSLKIIIEFWSYSIQVYTIKHVYYSFKHIRVLKIIRLYILNYTKTVLVIKVNNIDFKMLKYASNNFAFLLFYEELLFHSLITEINVQNFSGIQKT